MNKSTREQVLEKCGGVMKMPARSTSASCSTRQCSCWAITARRRFGHYAGRWWFGVPLLLRGGRVRYEAHGRGHVTDSAGWQRQRSRARRTSTGGRLRPFLCGDPELPGQCDRRRRSNRQLLFGGTVAWWDTRESLRGRSQRQSAARKQRQPNRRAQGSRQMCDCRIRRDHQVEIRDHRRGIHEGTGRFIQPAAKSSSGKSTVPTCSEPDPFCRLINCTPGTRASGAKSARGIERQRSAGIVGEPCQTMPILKPSIWPAPDASADL